MPSSGPKKRVLFVAPPFDYFPNSQWSKKYSNYSRPPLGLCYVASYLRSFFQEEVEICLMDGMLHSEREIVTFSKAFQPEIIGVSAVTATIVQARSLAAKVRRVCPKALLICGGPHPSVRPGDAFPEFDLAIMGEGERPFVQVIKNYEKGSGVRNMHIPGVVHPAHDEQDIASVLPQVITNLDELPFPDRSLLEMDKYYHSYPYRTARGHFTTLFTSRGCNFHCSFCGCHAIFPGSKRYFSLPYIKEEIAHVVHDHHCTLVFFDDDELLLEQERLADLCEHLLKKKYPLKWICHGRPEGADLELMKLMKAAGCVEIQVGVESGDETVLKRMGRNYSLATVEKFFNTTRKVGINTWATFVLGHPGETEATLNATLDAALKTDPTYVSFITLLPFPGTRVFEEFDSRNRLKTRDWSRYSWHADETVFVPEHLSENRLLELRAELFRRFYLRPGKLLRIFMDVVRSRRFYEVKRNFFAWLSVVTHKERNRLARGRK